MIKLEPQQKLDLFNIVKRSAPDIDWWECELRTALKKISPLFYNPCTSDLVNGYLLSCGYVLNEIYEIKEVTGTSTLDRGQIARELKAMVYHADCETNEEYAELFNKEVLPLIRKEEI